MEPLISVIVPYYKVSALKLRICLESFINQAFSDFELLLIDDGNSNEYAHIENEFTKRDGRIHFIHKNHAGVSAARNYGISLARGKYLAFCDADDFVGNSYLYSLYKGIQDCDLVMCGIEEQWYPVCESKVDMHVFKSIPSQYLWLQYVNFTVNKLYRMDLIKEDHIRFDENITLGEDALFLQKYLASCNYIRCFSDRIYHYVPSQSSAIHTVIPGYWSMEKQVIELQYKFFTEYPLCEAEQFFMQKWLYTKFDGCFNYYLQDEKNKYDNVLEQITKNPYLLQLTNCEDLQSNPHFTKPEIKKVQAWKKGGRGIYASQNKHDKSKLRYGLSVVRALTRIG